MTPLRIFIYIYRIYTWRKFKTTRNDELSKCSNPLNNHFDWSCDHTGLTHLNIICNTQTFFLLNVSTVYVIEMLKKMGMFIMKWMK